MVIASLLFLAALEKAATVLILIATGIFLALALNAPVQWIAGRLPGKKRNNRTLATGLSFLIVVVFLVGFTASIVPPLVSQTSSFINAAPRLVDDLRKDDSTLGAFVQKYNLESQVSKVSAQLGKRTDDIAGSAFSTLSRIGSSVFATLAVLVIAFMMLVESPRWIRFIKSFVPKDKLPRVERLTGEMYGVVKGFVNGQVLLAALAACIIVVPLFALDISYPVALMVIVFIAGLIPMVGHYVGITIVTLVALFTSVGSALAILVFYIVYQQIENYAVQPKVQANTTNLSPLLVFTSVLIGVSFAGLLGGLVAIPVAGCIKIILKEYLEAKREELHSA